MYLLEGTQRALLIDTAQDTPEEMGKNDLKTVVRHLLGHNDDGSVRANPVDFVVANHYTATHPNSPFKTRLMLSRFTPRGRVSVLNREATIVDHGHSRTVTLATRSDLRALLRERFGFDLPEVEAAHFPFAPDWA